MARIHCRIQIEVGLGERTIGRVAHAARRIAAQAGPVVDVMPAGCLNVELGVAGREGSASGVATAAAWNAVILSIASPAAKTADVDGAVIERHRSTTISALIDGAGYRSGEIGPAGI